MKKSDGLDKSSPNKVLSTPKVESINTSLSPKLALRPYQLQSLSQVKKAHEKGKNRLLVSLPTGCGKTVIFAHLVANTSGRSLVLAHRDELIEQAADKIRMVLPTADIGIVKAERNQVDQQIVIASIQTLTRESRLAQLKKDFSVVIIDEAHHACSKSYKKVLQALGSFNSKNAPLTLGVTATPERGDKVGLDSVFQEIVYHCSLLEMVAEQYLSDLTWQEVKFNVDLDKVETRAGDFIEAQLIKALSKSDAPQQILYAFKTYAKNRKTLIFVPGVIIARSIAMLFKENGILCESIDGNLPSKERKGILSRLHTGETQVVINCMILTEGFDEPTIDCIIFARPTKSKSFYLQMLGRGTRLHPNKKDCLVIDLVGVSNRHDLITLPNLFGIADTRLKKKSLLTVTEEIEEEFKAKIKALDLLAEQEKALAEAKKQTQKKAANQHQAKELPNNTKNNKKTLRFNWLKLSEKCYALSAGNKGIVFLISKDEIDWSVVFKEKTTTSLIAETLSLEYAMGIAQDFIRSLGVSPLIDIDANWRKEGASEKQLSLLQNMNISHSQNITKGLASDLLAIHFGKQELDNYQKTLLETNSAQPNNIQSLPNLPNLPKNSFENQPLQIPPRETDNISYKPTFAKNYFPPLTDQFIKYDNYRLHNYKPEGDISSRVNRSQSLALAACQEYLNNYYNQEVGIVLCGESQVGKTHLAVAILNELTNKYGIDTLFCDYGLLLKKMHEPNNQFIQTQLIEKIKESKVILLDGFYVRNTLSVTMKKLMSKIIISCKDSYYDKKLILTTRHHSYSSSYNEVESFRLSLGDILGSDISSRLYEQCHYLEIMSANSSLNDRKLSKFSPVLEIANSLLADIFDLKEAV